MDSSAMRSRSMVRRALQRALPRSKAIRPLLAGGLSMLVLASCTESLLESATPDELQVTPATLSVRAGSTSRLTATALSQDRVVPGVPVQWSSSAPSVATVDNSGQVTGVARGTTQVTARVTGTNATTNVAVTVLGVSAVTLNVSAASVDVGRTQQLLASVTVDPGVTPAAVSWSSSNPAVATVSTSGLVTGVSVGQAVITAQTEGRSATATISVTRPAVASLTLSPTSLALQVGQTGSFTPTARDAIGNLLTDRVVTWSTSNGAVASVSTAGVVTAVAPGNATISATVEGVTRTATVTVLNFAITSVSVSPSSASLSVGQTRTLVPTVTQPSGAPGVTISYGTSAPSVATVSSSGVVTAVSSGTATITVTATALGNASFSSSTVTATALITVASLPPAVTSISVTPSSVSLSVGQVRTLFPTVTQPSGAIGASLTYGTSAPSVATVSGSGVVTAVAPGSATITVTATAGGNSSFSAASQTATVAVTVGNSTVTSVQITPTSVVLGVGQTQTLTATGRDPNGSTVTGRTVTWSSLNSSIASVSSSGVVTGVASGVATIQATIDGVQGTVSVTVGCGTSSITSGATISGFANSGLQCSYSFASGTSLALRLSITTSAFNPAIYFANSGATFNWGWYSNSIGALNVDLLAAAGTTLLSPGSYSNGGGIFNFSVVTLTSDQAICGTLVGALKGASVGRALSTSDCLANSKYHDAITVRLDAGETMTIEMNSTAFDAFLEIYNSSNALLAVNDDGGGGTNSRLVYTAATTGFYTVRATSYDAAATGAYSISFR